MTTENLEILKQLIETFEKAEEKLEKAYKREKHEDFNTTKRYMLEIQNKISKLIKI